MKETQLCPTCGGGQFPGREITECGDRYHPWIQKLEDELRYILSLDSDIGTRAELVERYEEVYSYRMPSVRHRELVRYCVLFVLPS